MEFRAHKEDDTNDNVFTIPAKWFPHPTTILTKPNLTISTLKEVASSNKGESEGYYVDHITKKSLHIQTKQNDVLFFFALIRRRI